MSINNPSVNKSLQKRKSIKFKNGKPQRTISSDFHFKKQINLEDLFGGIFFSSKGSRKKFDGKDVIEEALQIGKRIKTESQEHSKDNTYIKFSDELVLHTQISARNNYIENISRKFKMGLHENFRDELIKCSGQGVMDLENKIENIEKTKEKYELAKIEHINLEQKLVDLNNDLRLITNKLSEKNQLINKEQIKFASFKIIQPIFEELIREFPEEEPKELISSFRRNKDKYLSQIHELNKLNEKIYEIEKERKKEENRNQKFQSNINNKILEQKMLTDSMVNHYEKEFKIYKDEHEILKNYTKENIVLKQLLYNIYSWIKDYINPKKYEQFIKKLGYDPMRSKRKFDVTIFNKKEFVSLVNENILSSVTTCHDGVLLRTTIAFGNYLARRHLKHPNKYRYDPVGTFREIKSAIDAKEFENYQLQGVIKNLTQKKMDSYLKIKELEHQVQKAKIKFQGLLTKFEKYIKLTNEINKKVNSINSFSNNETRIEDKKSRSTSAYPTLVHSTIRKKTLNSLDLRKSIKEEEIKEKKYKIIKSEKEKKDSKKSKKNINKTTNGFYNIRRKFFLTNDGKIKKEKKGKEQVPENKNIENLKNSISKELDNKKRTMTETNKINDSLDTSKNDDNDLYKEVQMEIRNHTLSYNKNHLKRFKDLEISKNRDKLMKTNGFNGTENLLMNIKDIMNELIYTENPKQIMDKYKEEKNNVLVNKKFESLQTPKSRDVFHSLEKEKDANKDKTDYTSIKKNIKRPFSTLPNLNYGKDYLNISNKIMADIDNIISKVNEIDLHDFSTNQNYKEQRKIILSSKPEKEEKIEKKNSIDSLINEKNEDNSMSEDSEEEEEEEEEEKEKISESNSKK